MDALENQSTPLIGTHEITSSTNNDSEHDASIIPSEQPTPHIETHEIPSSTNNDSKHDASTKPSDQPKPTLATTPEHEDLELSDDEEHDEQPSFVQESVSKASTIFDTYILPPKTRSAMLRIATSHPLLTSFLICQLAISGIPLTIFGVGLLVTAAIAATIYSCFALFILVPVLMITTFVGVCLWGWAWGVYMVGKWILGSLVSDGWKENGIGEKGAWVVQERELSDSE